jgi:hypothetical protein
VRKKFRPKGEYVIAEQRRLYYEGFHNLYCIKFYYDDNIKRGEMGGECSKHARNEKYKACSAQKT